jgi:hypothetical protein
MTKPDLVIDPEFKDLLPWQTPDELRLLEKNLLQDGCLDSIKIWKGTNIIIDGMTRYPICQKHGIYYGVPKEIELADRAAVIEWIIETQLGRRNLTDAQRIDLAERLKPKFEAEAKANQLRGANLPSDVTGGDVRQNIADEAGVSTGQVTKYEAVKKHAPAETVAQVRAGKKSIHRAYQETRKPKAKPKRKTTGPKDLAELLMEMNESEAKGKEKDDIIDIVAVDVTDTEPMTTQEALDYAAKHYKGPDLDGIVNGLMKKSLGPAKKSHDWIDDFINVIRERAKKLSEVTANGLPDSGPDLYALLGEVQEIQTFLECFTNNIRAAIGDGKPKLTIDPDSVGPLTVDKPGELRVEKHGDLYVPGAKKNPKTPSTRRAKVARSASRGAASLTQPKGRMPRAGT